MIKFVCFFILITLPLAASYENALNQVNDYLEKTYQEFLFAYSECNRNIDDPYLRFVDGKICAIRQIQFILEKEFNIQASH